MRHDDVLGLIGNTPLVGVPQLSPNPDVRIFAKLDAHRPFSFHEMKSDLVLPNGARFYNDHTHPEYSTPECRTLRDLLAHDRAGERIVQRAAERRSRMRRSAAFAPGAPVTPPPGCVPAPER